MRLWFVSELYYPEETSTGYFITHLAEGLASSRRVSVLCSQPTYSARGRRAPRREVRGGVDIYRCRSTTFDKDWLIGRVINLLTISVSIFLTAVRRIKANDVVIVVTNPPVLPFITWLAARLRSARFVLLVHDVYPDVLYATGVLHKGSWTARFAEAIVGRLYRSAERVVVIGRDMEELVARKLNGHGTAIVRIPNWADVHEITALPRGENPLLEALGISTRWIIQCSGNMGRTHGLEVIIEAAHILRTTAPDAQFLLCGSGARFPLLEQEAATAGTNLTVLETRPRSELNTLLNACDVALVCFREGMAGVSVPSRMYNILAAGKPIIAVADRDSELACLVMEANVGWVVPPGQPELLAEAIVRARDGVVSDPDLPLRARHTAERYTLVAAIAAYEQLMTGLGHREVPVVHTSSHDVEEPRANLQIGTE